MRRRAAPLAVGLLVLLGMGLVTADIGNAAENETAPESAQLHKGKSSKEKNLLLRSTEGSWDLLITPPDQPDYTVRLLCPEAFVCRNWKEVGNDEEVFLISYHWSRLSNGIVVVQGEVTRSVSYEVTATPHPEFVSLEIKVANHGQQTFEDLYAVMCLNLRDTPMMFDPKSDPTGLKALGRVFVQIDGRRCAAIDTDHKQSRNKVMPFYFLKTTPLADRWAPIFAMNYGWAVSKDVVDCPVVAMVSRDGKLMAGHWFQPAHHVLANWIQPPHGCQHSEASFGTLEPGQSATASGRVYLQAGSMDEVWTQMVCDWKRASDQKATETVDK